MMARTYRGMICVPHWDDELAEIRQQVDDATAWMRSIGIPWPSSGFRYAAVESSR
jgi:hypothetical protein